MSGHITHPNRQQKTNGQRIFLLVASLSGFGLALYRFGWIRFKWIHYLAFSAFLLFYVSIFDFQGAYIAWAVQVLNYVPGLEGVAVDMGAEYGVFDTSERFSWFRHDLIEEARAAGKEASRG